MSKRTIFYSVELFLSLVLMILYFVLLGKAFLLSVPILLLLISLPLFIVASFFLKERFSFYIRILIPIIIMTALTLLIDSQIYDFTDFFTGIVMYGDKTRVPLHFSIDIISVIFFLYSLVLIFIMPEKVEKSA